MRGNHFGKMFSLTTFGESHGTAVGVVVDGVPASLDFSIEDLKKELDRRAWKNPRYDLQKRARSSRSPLRGF